jgi:hypothetical protein
MCNPAVWYAACSCSVARQQKLCKHEAAFLATLALRERQADAMRLTVQMAGTLLGFMQGCSMEDVSNLSEALMEMLPLGQTAEDIDAAATNHGEMAAILDSACVAEAGAPAEEMNAAQPWPPPEQRNAPVGMGVVALHNHEAEMQRMLDEALQALRRADPGNQQALATQQKSALVRLLDVSKVAASKVHAHHTSFATSEQVSFKRHRSALEKHLLARRRVTTTQCQKDFVPERLDDSHQIFKAFGGGRSALACSEHVQACVNRSSRTDSARPPLAELNVQQQQMRHAQQQPQQQLQHQQHRLQPSYLSPPQAEPLLSGGLCKCCLVQRPGSLEGQRPYAKRRG